MVNKLECKKLYDEGVLKHCPRPVILPVSQHVSKFLENSRQNQSKGSFQA